MAATPRKFSSYKDKILGGKYVTYIVSKRLKMFSVHNSTAIQIILSYTFKKTAQKRFKMNKHQITSVLHWNLPYQFVVFRDYYFKCFHRLYISLNHKITNILV